MLPAYTASGDRALAEDFHGGYTSDRAHSHALITAWACPGISTCLYRARFLTRFTSRRHVFFPRGTIFFKDCTHVAGGKPDGSECNVGEGHFPGPFNGVRRDRQGYQALCRYELATTFQTITNRRLPAKIERRKSAALPSAARRKMKCDPILLRCWTRSSASRASPPVRKSCGAIHTAVALGISQLAFIVGRARHGLRRTARSNGSSTEARDGMGIYASPRDYQPPVTRSKLGRSCHEAEREAATRRLASSPGSIEPLARRPISRRTVLVNSVRCRYEGNDDRTVTTPRS